MKYIYIVEKNLKVIGVQTTRNSARQMKQANPGSHIRRVTVSAIDKLPLIR